jgi:DEAD/DEAH box helicase domain-containing protein
MKYDNNPALMNPIRNIPKIIYELIDVFSRELLESITVDRVPFTLYKQAIHILKGQSYLVIDVCHERHVAICQKINVDYITSPEKYSSFEPKNTEMRIKFKDLVIKYGQIVKTVTSFGYNIIDPKTKAIKETIENIKKDTLCEVVNGLWIKVPMEYNPDFESHNKGIHSLQHVIVKLFPIYTTSSVRACCCGSRKTSLVEYVMVYDQKIVAGKDMEKILMNCEDVLKGCACVDGCESCIYIDSCTVHNTFLSRTAAMDLLRVLKSKFI